MLPEHRFPGPLVWVLVLQFYSSTVGRRGILRPGDPRDLECHHECASASCSCAEVNSVTPGRGVASGRDWAVE
ncbi:hypothetical protein LZ32DRAFT_197858 [Colletotrichum eremochloae]|nr:hypothetical protein LZ32DRAFT_197858 [Colletotrichum eremochloae]